MQQGQRNLAEPNNTPRRQQQALKSQPQPITRHPLFPAIVGLWFAALLGMGSFVLSTSLLEALVLATHLDSVIPAAAPPLGVTARLVLAIGFGAIGGVIGWVLALRVANPTQKPAPHVFQVADLPEPMRATIIPAKAPEVRVPTLDPASLIEDIEDIAIAAPPPAVEAEAFAAVDFVREPVQPEVILPEPVAVEPAPPPPAPTAAERIAGADLAELSHVELIERLAIALQNREARRDAIIADAAEKTSPILHFPDFSDRRGTRQAPPVSAALPPEATPLRAAPQATETALREALAQLQRMSRSA